MKPPFEIEILTDPVPKMCVLFTFLPKPPFFKPLYARHAYIIDTFHFGWYIEHGLGLFQVQIKALKMLEGSIYLVNTSVFRRFLIFMFFMSIKSQYVRNTLSL